MHLKKVSLESIGNGVARDLFERELATVAANINDMSTPAGAPRKIVMTFTFRPEEDRRETLISVQAKSTLAQPVAHHNTVFVGRVEGRSVILGDEPDEE